MATGKAISGAAAVLYIGEQSTPIGWCTGVNAQETLEYAPIDVIGDVDVQGHEPLRRTVSMSAAFVRIKNESLQSQQAWVRGETLDVIAWPQMRAVLFDTASGVALYTIEGLYPQTRSWQVQKGSVITINATFYARKMVDELGV